VLPFFLRAIVSLECKGSTTPLTELQLRKAVVEKGYKGQGENASALKAQSLPPTK
jgi:hypothetical protein